MPNDALLRDLADCGSAETLLAAILKHHPDLAAPVQVEDIARRVGIAAFRDEAGEGVASALHTNGDEASILLSPGLSTPRRRFAIAHQLGHFLLKSQSGNRFCTTRDLSENRRDTPHRKEEMQANRFAAGLLMPKPLMATSLESLGKPAIAHMEVLAAAYGVTIQAAASRYVDITPWSCAILLIRDGVVHYARPSRLFPPMSIKRGDPAPASVRVDGIDQPTPWLAAEARDWLILSRDLRIPKVSMQVLAKKNGLQLVMLFINAASEKRADEEAEKYATERPKFGRPDRR